MLLTSWLKSSRSLFSRGFTSRRRQARAGGRASVWQIGRVTGVQSSGELLEDRCLLSAGDLDTTFGGGDGIVTTPIGSSYAVGSSVAVDGAGNYYYSAP